MLIVHLLQARTVVGWMQQLSNIRTLGGPHIGRAQILGKDAKISSANGTYATNVGLHLFQVVEPFGATIQGGLGPNSTGLLVAAVGVEATLVVKISDKGIIRSRIRFSMRVLGLTIVPELCQGVDLVTSVILRLGAFEMAMVTDGTKYLRLKGTIASTNPGDMYMLLCF